MRRLGFSFHVPEIEDVEVVVVDDDRTSLALTEAYVRRAGHPVRAFNGALEALESIQRSPPKILVTDMVMPGISGVDLAHEARAVDPDMGVILVTGYGDANTAEATVQLGVDFFLTKPLELERLQRALQRAFLKRAADDHHRAMVNWMYDAMARNAGEIRDVTLGMLTSLMNALDARSPYFRGHSRAVADQAVAVAETMGLDEVEVEAIRIAGMLHDIGMIGVPDEVVHKREALTEAELELIRAHCQTGAGIIEPMSHIAGSRRYVLEHHERWDGSGYPAGKRGDEISLGGQIVGICEAWVAILEGRAYREGRSRQNAVRLLSDHQGAWFTPEVTKALIDSDLGLL
ncbi:MAG TPA: HD domain-containing phosphohydrolase [Longimicrobiales bacterium]|nr:HD domain-containing phosphohydrolase [Longimicrobiales bacterium]